jgi:hypothetical protein
MLKLAAVDGTSANGANASDTNIHMIGQLPTISQQLLQVICKLSIYLSRHYGVKVEKEISKANSPPVEFHVVAVSSLITFDPTLSVTRLIKLVFVAERTVTSSK